VLLLCADLTFIILHLRGWMTTSTGLRHTAAADITATATSSVRQTVIRYMCRHIVYTACLQIRCEKIILTILKLADGNRSVAGELK